MGHTQTKSETGLKAKERLNERRQFGDCDESMYTEDLRNYSILRRYSNTAYIDVFMEVSAGFIK
jgi:hypothetical protein